jgi:3-phenylpropionate/trans-cinnamate dioxygenase ferredoxin component
VSIGDAVTDSVRACAIADVPVDGALHVDLAGRPIAIVNSEGVFYAIQDMCSHENVPLSEGDVDGTTIECWLHGSCFDLATGAPTGLPATRPVPVYPVTVAGDDLFVRLAGDNPQEEK